MTSQEFNRLSNLKDDALRIFDTLSNNIEKVIKLTDGRMKDGRMSFDEIMDESLRLAKYLNEKVLEEK